MNKDKTNISYIPHIIKSGLCWLEKDLWRIRAPCGTCEGFDVTPMDEMIQVNSFFLSFKHWAALHLVSLSFQPIAAWMFSAISGFPRVPRGRAPPLMGVPVPCADVDPGNHDLRLHATAPSGANRQPGITASHKVTVVIILSERFHMNSLTINSCHYSVIWSLFTFNVPLWICSNQHKCVCFRSGCCHGVALWMEYHLTDDISVSTGLIRPIGEQVPHTYPSELAFITFALIKGD